MGKPVITEQGTEQYTGVTGPKIRCPLCAWEPQQSDTWACTCGNEWHTFNTGGVCPACIHEWKSTECLSCHGWSAHSDWYVY
jgi:predicted amidophosphoribosyltransferase